MLQSVQISFYFYTLKDNLFDITPLKTSLTSATIATTNASAVCTITKSAHGLSAGDIIQLDSVTLPGGTGYKHSDFEDKNFQVTILLHLVLYLQLHNQVMQQKTVSTGGTSSIKPYETVGPRAQSYGYGWGIDGWGIL